MQSARLHTSAMTLIELILVMGLLATIMALAAPSLGRFFGGRAIEDEARRILAITRYARSQAISLGVPMECWFEPDTGLYGVAPAPNYDIEDKMPREFHLDKNLSLKVLGEESALSGALLTESLLPEYYWDEAQAPGSLLDAAIAEIEAEQGGETRITFLPNGRIARTLPETLALTSDRGESLRIVPNATATGYEIEGKALTEYEIVAEETATE